MCIKILLDEYTNNIYDTLVFTQVFLTGLNCIMETQKKKRKNHSFQIKCLDCFKTLPPQDLFSTFIKDFVSHLHYQCYNSPALSLLTTS